MFYDWWTFLFFFFFIFQFCHTQPKHDLEFSLPFPFFSISINGHKREQIGVSLSSICSLKPVLHLIIGHPLFFPSSSFYFFNSGLILLKRINCSGIIWVARDEVEELHVKFVLSDFQPSCKPLQLKCFSPPLVISINNLTRESSASRPTGRAAEPVLTLMPSDAHQKITHSPC